MKVVRPLVINDAVLSASNIAETDYAAYNAATTYALGDRVIVAADHKIYESLQAGNVGHTPSSSPTWWLDCGATNRWKMFDSTISSQSSNANSIEVQLTTVGRIDTIALLNIRAHTATVTITHPTDGTLYTETKTLTNPMGINTWFDYFYEPFGDNVTDVIFADIPLYAGVTTTITLTYTGSTVKCGACIVGQSRNFGGTQQGATVGITDYSVKTQDSFGNYTIVERSFRKTASFSFWIDNASIDVLQNILASFRATPILYVGDHNHGSTMVYGFYKDFSISLSYPTISVCTLSLEGLI